jgi:hypothetical protein
MVMQSKKGVEACKQAAQLVQGNSDEFGRFRSDVEATHLLACFYQRKISAAIHFVAYQRKQQPEDSQEVVRLLYKSVEYYRELVRNTDRAYKIANDMRNDIPFPFHPPTGIAPLKANSIPHLPHWRDFLPVFEAELDQYRKLLETR